MFEHHKRKKLLATSPLLTPETPDGTKVRVTGRVSALDHALIAPASGRPAVIFGIEATDVPPNEPGGIRNHTPFASVDACPFVLESETAGLVMIASDFVVLVDVPARRIDTVSAHWEAYCVRTGLLAKHPAEQIVQHGHRITLVGSVERRPVAPGQEAGFRDTASVIYVVGDFDHPLLIEPAAS
ncbi:hypothetical protein BH11MYX1_BH11MYX1_36290 [soil metagenome]